MKPYGKLLTLSLLATASNLSPAEFASSPSSAGQLEPSGTLVLRDCILVEPRSMYIVIYDAKSTNHICSCRTTVDVDGTFYACSMPNGTYDLYLFVSGFLGRKFNDVKVVNGDFTGLNATLVNGDINDDNVINQGDYDQIDTNYNLTFRDTTWDRMDYHFVTPKMCDVNCDGSVDAKDRAVVMKSWERKGDSCPKWKEAAPKKAKRKKGWLHPEPLTR